MSQGMTYLLALQVLNNEGGKIARRSWNGQSYVYTTRPGDEANRRYMPSEGGNWRYWRGLSDPKFDDNATDWLDMTNAVTWAEALKQLRSGTWKGAMRLSWAGPSFIERYAPKHERGAVSHEWDSPAVLESWIPSVAREFVCIDVISGKILPFAHNTADLCALDWVEATPENMQRLMPTALCWKEAVYFLEARKFSVKRSDWDGFTIRQVDAEIVWVYHGGAGRPWTPNYNPADHTWDVLPPDWFVEQYAKAPATVAAAPYFQPCSVGRAKEYLLQERRKVRPAYWEKVLPNQYLYAVEGAIWIHWNDGKETYWDNTFSMHLEWQVLPPGWQPAPKEKVSTNTYEIGSQKPMEEFSVTGDARPKVFYGDTNKPIDTAMIYTLPGAKAAARKLIAAGRPAQMRRIAWGLDQAVVYKEVPYAGSVNAPPVTIPFLWHTGSEDMTHWIPTYQDSIAQDWLVSDEVVQTEVVSHDDAWRVKKLDAVDLALSLAFSEALTLLKEGRRVARRGWGKPYYIQLHKSTDYSDCIIMGRPDSSLTPMYDPTTDDLLAEDWYEVKP